MGNKQYKTNTSYTDFFYYAFRNILLVSVPILIISALILSVPHSSADNSNTSTDTFTLTLDVSCTINSTVLEPHNIHLEGSGLHRENIGTTKIGTYCNDNNGYNIYAIGSSNNIDGNTDLVADSGLSSEYNIKTGVYDGSADSLYNSSWSMKLTAGVGTGIDPITGNNIQTSPPTIDNGYNNYNVVPNAYTLVASRSSGTNMNSSINTDVTGSYFTTTYDVYASSVQPAGTYTGKVKYILTHPNTNAPNTISDIDAAFATAGKQKVYQDSEGSYYAMQDMTSDICNSVSSNGERTSTQLVDIRDHKLYYVTKLADGHCWMTQNLDFDIVVDEQDSTKMKTLTSEDTDLTDHSLTGAYADDYNYDPNTSITTWTPERETIDFQNTTVTGWQNSNTEPYSASKTDSAETGHASLGNYYNWTAAIASNDSSSLTQSTLDNISNNPKNSICPKGWRLPTISNQSETESGSTNEFARLNYLYNNNSSKTGAGLIIDPVWFVKAGNIWSTSYANLNTVSHNWSSTYYNSTKAYEFSLSSSEVGKQNWDRVLGFSVRCVAR